ncbi:MAG: hypothetical protein V4548_01900 [Bacteroidota bacterium]
MKGLFISKYNMPHNPIYTEFFNQVKSSIDNDTFAKLTLAKTIGNTDLMNIYMRSIIVENELRFSLTYKFQQSEEVTDHTFEEAVELMIPYINNPFMSCLLFTTEADVTMKLNKKRVASITEKAPTFKNADAVLLEFRSK